MLRMDIEFPIPENSDLIIKSNASSKTLDITVNLINK